MNPNKATLLPQDSTTYQGDHKMETGDYNNLKNVSKQLIAFVDDKLNVCVETDLRLQNEPHYQKQCEATYPVWKKNIKYDYPKVVYAVF